MQGKARIWIEIATSRIYIWPRKSWEQMQNGRFSPRQGGSDSCLQSLRVSVPAKGNGKAVFQLNEQTLRVSYARLSVPRVPFFAQHPLPEFAPCNAPTLSTLPANFLEGTAV